MTLFSRERSPLGLRTVRCARKTSCLLVDQRGPGRVTDTSLPFSAHAGHLFVSGITVIDLLLGFQVFSNDQDLN